MIGVALAEEHLAGQDPRQEIALLLVGAELDDRVGDHPDAHRRQRRREAPSLWITSNTVNLVS